ncbi:hypothetical protein [Photobacterium minamisatsumaniensis]|uniref:hypothetical protein n=1 Tax=Photobacterium minamisatsumaniensis TaxID=2910233 RepID=UPI003D12E6C7
MTTKITSYSSCNEQGIAIARYLLGEIKTAKNNNRHYLLGCPGGRSPMAVYNAMADLAEQGGDDLSKLIIIMMDDYVLETSDGLKQADDSAHYSCRRFAEIEIRQRLNSGLETNKQITKENVWFPSIDSPESYDERIKQAGGIDYFILATGGSDGHVAFNPPGTLLSEITRITKLADTTRSDNLGTFPEFTSLAEVPTYGLTVGPASIALLSKEAGLLIDGEHKQFATRKLFNSTSYEEDWPSTIIHECLNGTLHIVKSAIPKDLNIE